MNSPYRTRLWPRVQTKQERRRLRPSNSITPKSPGPPAPSGRLTVVDGPDRGKSLPLGEDAVTLGSDADCTLSLADPYGRVAGHHARIWLREGHFMLHHLAGGRYTTVVGENTVRWVVLEDGDEIVIGPHRLRFEAVAPSQGTGKAGGRVS